MEAIQFSAPSSPPSADVQPAEDVRPEPSTSFFGVLKAVGERIDAGEKLMAAAERPRINLDARQLIALQAGIYRYTEAVELAAKIVDRSTNALKTTLQSQ